MGNKAYICPLSARISVDPDKLWLPTDLAPIEIADISHIDQRLYEIINTALPDITGSTYFAEAGDGCMACFVRGNRTALVTRSPIEINLATQMYAQINALEKHRAATKINRVILLRDHAGKTARLVVDIGYCPITDFGPARDYVGDYFDRARRVLLEFGVSHGDVTERWLCTSGNPNCPPVMGLGLSPIYAAWRRAALAEGSEIAKPDWVLKDAPTSPIGQMQCDPRFYRTGRALIGDVPSVNEDIKALRLVTNALQRMTGSFLPTNDSVRKPTTGVNLPLIVIESPSSPCSEPRADFESLEQSKNQQVSYRSDIEYTSRKTQRHALWILAFITIILILAAILFFGGIIGK